MKLGETAVDAFFIVVLSRCISYDGAGQRAGFHSCIFISRGLYPAIRLGVVEILVGWCRSGIIKNCFSYGRVQTDIFSLTVTVPRVIDEFLQSVACIGVEFLDVRQIPAYDNASRTFVCACFAVLSHREVSV